MTFADFMSPSVACPAWADDGSEIDAVFLDSVLTLWMNADKTRPSLRVGRVGLNRSNAGRVEGKWQLHVFSFATEARQALQTLKIISPDTSGEAGVRSNGEGLLLLRQGDGPFTCQIVDRRKTGAGLQFTGSWELTSALATRAALHIPSRVAARAEAAIKLLASEFEEAEEKAALYMMLGSTRLDRCVGLIGPQDVLNAANKILEPLGLELSCSDRQIFEAIDAHLSSVQPDVTGMVDRIAHELLAELGETGYVG